MAKVAVILCHGCELATALDLAALERIATRCDGVVHVRSAARLCDASGASAIDGALATGAASLVVVACASRFHTRAFARDGCQTERVALRELAVYSHAPNHEDTQMLAEDLLRMGLARAARIVEPQPEPLPVERAVLVVGAGPAGMAAALGAARAGYGVVLVDRQPAIGGWLRSWGRTTPHRAPYRNLEPAGLDALVRAIDDDPRIEVHRSTVVTRVSGQPGQFDVELKAEDHTVCRRVGAIVQATGWKPYDASRLPHLGYGRSPDVITNVDMERLLLAGAVLRPSDSAPARRIAFIQCAGSRDRARLPYCSSVCCRTTLKEALWARELDPACEVYVLARDMRTPGLHEEFYRRAQDDTGIFIAKGDVTAVEPSHGHIVVRLGTSQLGDDVELEVDLVVLATGMVPISADGAALREVDGARKELARGDSNVEAAKETVARLAHHEGTGVLGLRYRQGQELPLLEDGFPDSHFICFPYETRRTGIYAAGCVRAPADLEDCRVDGEGAALKAIQAIEASFAGVAVHPRWGDAAAPVFAMQRCTQCKRCTEECPFGSLEEDEKCTPRPNPGRCRRCGICMGACPERVISFADYSVDVVVGMIKAIEVPGEFDEKPRILMLMCENDAYPALELAGFHRQRYSSFVRAIPVRCLGAVNVVWVSDALARGFDGILLLGCKPGEDTQCHSVRGSELMATRTDNVRQKLAQMALEEQRVRIEHVALSDYLTLPGLIDRFVEQIQSLGPNPFKDA
jgi:quinone-modifying oxidoreductase subunit QmoB